MNQLPYDPVATVDQPSKKHFGSRRFWTRERCIADALRFNTRVEWVKNSGPAYGSASRNEWLEVCCAHMENGRKIIWTHDTILVEARKHTSVSAWEKESPGSYSAAKKRGRKTGLWDECTAHMTAQNSIAIMYHGVSYLSINQCLIAIGEASSSEDARKKFGGNIGRIVKVEGVSWEEAIDRIVFRKPQGLMVERAERRQQRETEDAIRQRQSLEQRHIDFWMQSFVTPVSPCGGCGKYARTPLGRGYICSDNCKDAVRKKHAQNNRKVRRLKGTDNRGKPRKRHAKHGGVYDYTITAQSVAIRDGMRCQMCGIRVTKHKGKGWQPNGWSVGHIIPVSKGGNTTWDNVRCECIICNTHKGAEVIDKNGQLAMMLMQKC